MRFLENLLDSFAGYTKYPILIVITDYRPSDRDAVAAIVAKYPTASIEVEGLESNSFELSGLHVALRATRAEEMLLLSHSCELVNTDLLDIVFEKHRGRSVAFGLETGNWAAAVRSNPTYSRIIEKYLRHDIHQRLLQMGDIAFWQAHVGKYRRTVLEQMNVADYLPTNMIEAIAMSEMLFTHTYHTLDPDTVVLFSDWRDGDDVVEKFGRRRMKIANDYLIKWKTHWKPMMVFEELFEKSFMDRTRRFVGSKLSAYMDGRRSARRFTRPTGESEPG